jgi:hypothetical protein
MLGMIAAAMSPCQKKTSPRISSVGTPIEMVLFSVVEMNVSA